MTFDGVRPVLHLAFDDALGEAIRYGDLDRLVARMLASGVDGLVVLGLASEACTLTEPERDAALDRVSTAVAQRVPVVVRIEGPTTVAVDRGRRAAALGASGLMVLPPARVGSGELLRTHLWRLGDEVGLPILVQDSPAVTGVVAGWGGLGYIESARRGAIGVMPGCDLGPCMVVIDRALRAGDFAAAERLYRTALPLLSYEARSLDLLLLGAKRPLRRQGILGADGLRSPSRRLDQEEEASLDGLFAELDRAAVPGFTGLTA